MKHRSIASKLEWAKLPGVAPGGLADAERLAEVVSNPEDDAPRRNYAEYIRPWEPDRAEYIEQEIEEARARRSRRGLSRSGKPPLLEKHEGEWTRTIAKYARSWKFDRGFIAHIAIDPHLFLEYGEWLFINAPIRSVAFLMPEEGPFPMKEIAGSSLLDRLNTIGFLARELGDDDLRAFAESPHLERLLTLSANKQYLARSIYEAFAAAPLTRKALSLLLSHEGFPGESFGDTGQDDLSGAAILGWREMRPEGRELEQKYGYLPWLHRENDCDPFDATYYVAQGILPVKPAGDPV